MPSEITGKTNVESDSATISNLNVGSISLDESESSSGTSLFSGYSDLQFNVTYKANTDGFVIFWMFNMYQHRRAYLYVNSTKSLVENEDNDAILAVMEINDANSVQIYKGTWSFSIPTGYFLKCLTQMHRK